MHLRQPGRNVLTVPRTGPAVPKQKKTKEKKGSEVDETVKSWDAFYTGPALPQVQRKPLWKQ